MSSFMAQIVYYCIVNKIFDLLGMPQNPKYVLAEAEERKINGNLYMKGNS